MGQHVAERNALLKEALGQLTKKETNKDDASVFAESWATSYRKLSPTQQIYAKRAIEEILVLGQLDLLSLHALLPIILPPLLLLPQLHSHCTILPFSRQDPLHLFSNNPFPPRHMKMQLLFPVSYTHLQVKNLDLHKLYISYIRKYLEHL